MPELREYQQGMRRFAHETWAKPGLRACGLGADMGLGKTLASLTVIDDSLHDYLDTERWCVVAPPLVASDTWPRELAKWPQFAHLRAFVVTLDDLDLEAAVAVDVDGQQVEMPLSEFKRRWPEAQAPRRCGLTFGTRADKAATKRRLLAKIAEHDITFVAWSRFPWLAKLLGDSWPFDGLVLDESDYAANASTDASKAAYHVTHRRGKVVRVMALSGKPTANGIEMMHGQMRALDGGARLGATKTAFVDAWMLPDKTDPRRGIVYSHKANPEKSEEFQRRVAELWITLRSDDYLQLPPQVVIPTYVTLGSDARRLYDAMERDLIAQLGDATVLAPSQGVLVNKLRQIANGAVYDSDKAWHAIDDAKLERLEELLESVTTPVILAYLYEPDWARVVKRIKGATNAKSPGALDRFRAGKVRLLGMHPASVAHGIDGLQDVCSDTVWFGATYNARHWYQLNARTRRNGQTASVVRVHQLMAADTIEEYIARVPLAERIDEQETLIDALRWRRSMTEG
jgi:hypothetical protein